MRTSSELHALRRLSAAIGADAALTQAAGGNTSIKLDGVMWIKASGTWLAHADNRDIFVPVKLDLLRQGIDGNDPACETCVDYVDHELNIGNLRPSVETTDNHVARLDQTLATAQFWGGGGPSGRGGFASAGWVAPQPGLSSPRVKVPAEPGLSSPQVQMPQFRGPQST